MKMKDESDDESVELKLEAEDTDSEDKSVNSSSDDDDDDENSDNNDDEDDDAINDSIKEEKENDEERCYTDSKRPRRISDDVNEGRTVFLKNVPFSVKNDELKGYMEQFGPVYYALICIDRLTEHSKGTAFVKFKARSLLIYL